MYNNNQATFPNKRQEKRTAGFGFVQKLVLVSCVMLLFLSANLVVPKAAAQTEDKEWGKVRSIYTVDYNIANPSGVVFSPNANAFLLWDENNGVSGITLREDPVDLAGLNLPVGDALNVAFDSRSNSVFFLDNSNSELGKISANADGHPNLAAGAATSFNLKAAGLSNAKGITLSMMPMSLTVRTGISGSLTCSRICHIFSVVAIIKL